MPRPKYSFSDYNDSALADKATLIHNLMSGLPQYNTPPVSYGNLQILINNFNNAIAAALNRDKVKVTEKRELRAQLEEALKSLAIYIMGITSDQLAIEQTGFSATVKGSPVGVPAAPQRLRTVSFGSNCIELDWDRVRGAYSYIVEMTTGDPENPQTVWSSVGTCTRSKMKVEQLNPLTYYWFRVRANGAAGLGIASAPCVGLSI